MGGQGLGALSWGLAVAHARVAELLFAQSEVAEAAAVLDKHQKHPKVFSSH